MPIPVEDLRQMYDKTVVFVNKVPCHIDRITDDSEFVARNLFTQRTSVVEYNEKAIRPPIVRLGMVNARGSVAFLTRVPVRQFWAGLHPGNTKVDTPAAAMHPEGPAMTKAHVASLCVPEVGDTLLNKYPTFKQAVKHVEKHGGAMAFDRQFAVSEGGVILYKRDKVGSLKKKTADDFSEIQFKEGFEYLTICLKGSYEECKRIATVG